MLLRNQPRTAEHLKELSIREFSDAAIKYEEKENGIYHICKMDYPDILAEIEREPFATLLDAGCGTAPMLSLLSKRYPKAQYTGIDLTPDMIKVAKSKHLPNTLFICGDCEHMPFRDDEFDVIICSNSFHHYPNPLDFFKSVKRCLRHNGRLILRDMTFSSNALMWFVNNIELPVLNCFGYGDVHIYNQRELQELCNEAGLTMERFERRNKYKLHAVIRKK